MDIDEEIWDIIEDGINIPVNFLEIASDRKSLTHARKKKMYKKHHNLRGLLVETLPFPEYTKIVNKYTTKSIFESLCVTYEGNQEVK